MKPDSLLFYCRAGFENDLANEVLDKSSALGVYGYPIATKQTGYLIFKCHQPSDAALLAGELKLKNIIFARQMLLCISAVQSLDSQDRVSSILQATAGFPQCGDLRVEYPDTTEGRELSKFCRKITVPLRQSMRKANRLTLKEHSGKPALHVFFIKGTEALLGYSQANNRSEYPLGILRLKFPSAAPSRSTLKLDEAFQVFIPPKEAEHRLAPGLQAVDLGACPGGWTYQLVQRGMFIQAVDNGAMDKALMETGQVSYFAEDGFKYQPKKKKVYWLVCDMIEQPQRVAKLMAQWLSKGWCQEAIFNLKLPMKHRYESVQLAMAEIDKVMGAANCPYQCQAKHLYHDREEITVHLR